MHSTRHAAPSDRREPARWADGDKDGIGCAIAETSRVWFSTAHGILTEVFYPAPDQACIRLLELVVTDGENFVSEEARDTQHAAAVPHEVAPVCGFLNSCKLGRYQIEKEIIADPLSDVILQRVRFTALESGDYRLFCVLEPHLGNLGDDNTALLGVHKGVPMLFALRDDGIALALACSAPIAAATAGFVGCDGRTALRAAGRLTSRVARADRGNVSLTAEVDRRDGDDLTIALAFARTIEEAAHLALGALHRGYDAARAQFIAEWAQWHATLTECRVDGAMPRLWTRSATILKTLEAKHPNGGRVAALSTPWGASRGPGLEGTYHLIWTRDLVESVGALLSTGAQYEAKHALHYLRCTQEADGHWPQNMHLDGEPVWNHTELDEVALPIVFLHLVRRDGLLTDQELRGHWQMVRRAAGFIAREGPAATLDRWEDTPGITVFTVSAAIVALLVAADVADVCGERFTAQVMRDLADQWNERIEGWLYRRGGALAVKLGIDGYYMRARMPGVPPVADLDLDHLPATELSPDALALVRFGLRAPDDPRIVNTVRAIDAILRSDLPTGPAWRRYPGDRYGEYPDGSPFDGDGIGRPWPLLTGERAHYELARGDRRRATELLAAMESFASSTGCFPEQVWDRADIPARWLVLGGPSGSATPLGWTHAEYVKLCRSLADGHVFDLPEHALERYVTLKTCPTITTWRVGDDVEPIHGRLRVACFAPATISWRADGDASMRTVATIDTGLGLHTADLAGAELRVTVHHDEPREGDGTEVTFSSKGRAK